MCIIKNQLLKAGVYFTCVSDAGIEILGEAAQDAYEKLRAANIATPQQPQWCPVTREAALQDFGDTQMEGDYLIEMLDDDGNLIECCLSDEDGISYMHVSKQG